MSLVSRLGSFVDYHAEQRGICVHTLEDIDAEKCQFNFKRYLNSRKHDIFGYEVVESSDKHVSFRIFSSKKTFSELQAQLRTMVQNITQSGRLEVNFDDPLKVIFLNESGFLEKLKREFDLWTVDIVEDKCLELQGLNDKLHQAANAAHDEALRIHSKELKRSAEFIVVIQHPSVKEFECHHPNNLVIHFDQIRSVVVILSTDLHLLNRCHRHMAENFFDSSSTCIDKDQLEYLESSNNKWKWDNYMQQTVRGLLYHEVFHREKRLHIIGLSTAKVEIDRGIAKFLDTHVIKQIPAGFHCDRNILKFMRENKSQQRQLRDLETKYGVEIRVNDTNFVIVGTTARANEVNLCLSHQHSNVQKGEHQITKTADIQHIHETPDFLEIIGREQNSLLIKQSTTKPSSVSKESLFSFKLPSGSICELREGDIVEVTDCDAIVNAAHESLNLGEGVAGAIRKRGRVMQICVVYMPYIYININEIEERVNHDPTSFWKVHLGETKLVFLTNCPLLSLALITRLLALTEK